MTDTTTPTVTDQFVMLDPTTVVVESNVRTEDKTYLTKEFVDSIRAEGVLTPVLCRRAEDGTVYVRAGQRRTLAAREAGVMLPARIVTADENTADRIVQQIIENDQREALSNADRAAAWQQLSLDGMAPTKIAKRTGRKASEVKAGLQVAESAVAVETVTKHDITLDQAAILIEFEDDADLHATLVEAAEFDPAQFEHEVQRARDERTERAQIAALTEEWAAKGYTVITESVYSGSEWYRAASLRKDGQPIDQDAPLPESIGEDRGVRVEKYFYQDEPTVTLYVRNEAQHGYDARPVYQQPTSQSGPMNDEQKAERKRLVANNKAWASAETVRREWIAKFLTRKTLPKDVTAFIATAVTQYRTSVADHMGRGNSLAATLLGAEDHGARDGVSAYLTSHPARAAYVTLAVVLGGVEGSTSKETWRYETERKRFAGYFTQLQTWGYVLSDVERIVLDGLPDIDAPEPEQATEAESEQGADIAPDGDEVE
ncbi:ParB family chromosome partitioning protein [Curtobacterium sp. AG1037]|uniref:ParB/RepB/Spo0J family partition protein n=1 Tax=Curtobacterium sp. AG1037 TaxID=2183990 RepID=UPI000E2E37A2|nr:ParB N-terminal domain-containing protein [Curtobacterium sp. AG1037]RDH95097.1 ParB family chromosome partitioning protein [Curtobacterium sp. AG1037]